MLWQMKETREGIGSATMDRSSAKSGPRTGRYFALLFLAAVLLSAYLYRDKVMTTMLQDTKRPMKQQPNQCGIIMIAVSLVGQQGYSKFTASVLRKLHENMLQHTHVFYSKKLDISEDDVKKWYGSAVTFHRHQGSNSLLANVFQILDFFKSSCYETVLVASSDLVLNSDVFDFIKYNINRTQLLQTYRKNASCHHTVDGLCAESNPSIIGSVMKKSEARILMQHFSWFKGIGTFDVVLNDGNIESLSPVDSVSVRIGQTINDYDCIRYTESRNFDRCQFSSEIQRGIEFYYDKCNPSDVYFDGKSNAEFYSKPAVVYSLYGGSPRYTDGVHANCDLMLSVYPEWKMWVYHDNSVPEKIMKVLCKCDAKLVDMTEANITNKRTWRFFIISENVRRYIVRDIDSRLSLRERAAVQEWINSSEKFHVMRDHPAHRNYPINAGMWGGVYGALPNRTIEKLQNLISNGKKNQDQVFLASEVWPIVSKSVYQHDSFPTKYGKVHPFPTPRNGYEHVGSIYINGKQRQGEADGLKKFLASMGT